MTYYHAVSVIKCQSERYIIKIIHALLAIKIQWIGREVDYFLISDWGEGFVNSDKV